MMYSALQTFWTQTRSDKIRDLIGIQTVWCSYRIPEKFFLKMGFLKKKWNAIRAPYCLDPDTALNILLGLIWVQNVRKADNIINGH